MGVSFQSDFLLNEGSAFSKRAETINLQVSVGHFRDCANKAFHGLSDMHLQSCNFEYIVTL